MCVCMSITLRTKCWINTFCACFNLPRFIMLFFPLSDSVAGWQTKRVVLYSVRFSIGFELATFVSRCY